MKRRKIPATRDAASALKVRPVIAADRAEWARMRQDLWPDCRPARSKLEMRELLGDPKKFGVLVLDRGDGRLGGFVELALRDGVDGAKREITAYVEGWWVDADLRGKAWGRKLIAAASRWAAQRGMVELASDAELWNEVGIAAHQRVGFREVERLVLFLKRVRRVPRAKQPERRFLKR
jgi:aminoglycoside 6'-N-acetyltransferase I